jgi:hypothetical protein
MPPHVYLVFIEKLRKREMLLTYAAAVFPGKMPPSRLHEVPHRGIGVITLLETRTPQEET